MKGCRDSSGGSPKGENDNVGLRVGVVSMSFSSPPGGILTVACEWFGWLSASPGMQLLLLA